MQAECFNWFEHSFGVEDKCWQSVLGIQIQIPFSLKKGKKQGKDISSIYRKFGARCLGHRVF